MLFDVIFVSLYGNLVESRVEPGGARGCAVVREGLQQSRVLLAIGQGSSHIVPRSSPVTTMCVWSRSCRVVAWWGGVVACD